MFKDAINGLDRILQADIPSGSVILITGAAGTLKSGLVFNMMSSYLDKTGEHGLYATLEQTKESHMRNMDCLGLSQSKNLHIFDYNDLRAEWKDQEPNMLKVTEDVIDYYIDKYENMTLFALDSLNALYALTSPLNLRRNMYYFFSMLREKGLTSFMIMETAHFGNSVFIDDPTGRPEHFLADGVIELGLVEAAEDVKRYIQIKKMRSSRHGMEKHQLVVDKGGLSVLGSIY